MNQKGLLVLLVIVCSLAFFISAAPTLKYVEVEAGNGTDLWDMPGNMSYGFNLLTNGDGLLDYSIQFKSSVVSNEPLKEEMFPLYLINSTVSSSDLKNYYIARGVPEPFLTYLQNATDGLVPYAYINGSNIKLADGAKYSLASIIEDMTVPGDYPEGSYYVAGDLKNSTDDLGNITLQLIIGIKIINKTDLICKYETDNITLEADLIGLYDEVWFSYIINNTNYNKSVTMRDSHATYTIPDTELLGNGEGNILWNVYATDTNSRVYNNSWKSFYLRKRTNFSVSPNDPDGNNGWYITEPEFSVIKDAIGGDVFYRWDNEDLIRYVLPFRLEDIPNAPPVESAGTLKLSWFTEFVCGNESKQSKIYYIDLTDPVITNLNPGNNSIVNNDLRPEISAYLDDVFQSNSGINISSVVMLVDGIDVTSESDISLADSIDATINYIPDSDLSIGTHNITINVSDFSGRNSSLTWSFDINVVSVLAMTVNSPENKTYDTRRVVFNISFNDEVELLEYINYNDRIPRWRKLCGNCNEYGLNRRKIKSLVEGNNTISIKATDEFGIIRQENITLFIDSRKPRISKLMPRRNSVINGSEFLIKYTEANLQDITLFWNGTKSLSNCVSGRNQECVTDADISDHHGEEIIFWFNVSDTINTVESKAVSVKVDTVSPIMTLYAPNSSVHGRYVQFNVSVSEEVTIEYKDELDSRPRWRRLCNRCDEYGEDRYRRRYFRKGEHNVTIRARDKAGNSDKEEVSFIVDY